MLVKRDNPISEPLETYSDAEDIDPLWPEDELMLPAVEPSGYRPAPKAIVDSAEETGVDESLSGLPTPRSLDWSSAPLTGSTPLPVVTATTEPTQRGLGIPPPPSSREAEWLSQMPSLTSLPPLAIDAFDDRPERRSDAGSAANPVEPTENERITVRAPPGRRTPRERRRRTAAALLLAAAAVTVVLFARRITLSPERVSAATAQVTSGSPAAPRAVTGRGSAAQAVVRSEETHAANESPKPPSTSDAVRATEETLADSQRPETRRERQRRARLEAAAARAPATTAVAAQPGSGLPDPSPVTGTKSGDTRETLSLPPR